MARTATNKSRSQERAKSARSNGEATTTTAAPEANGDTDPIARLRTAYQAATDARDATTGAIPDEHLQAVKAAYLAVRKRDRGEIAADLNAESAERMIQPDGAVDTSLAQAMGTLAALFKAHYGERTGVPHDPVPGISGILAGLDKAREMALAGLSDEQRDRVESIDLETDEGAQASYTATVTAIDKVTKRALNGRRRVAGNGGGPGRNLAEIVRKALAETDGDTVVLNYVARTYDVSTGALGNRWDKNNIDGVRAVKDPDGKKAFQAAA